MTDEQIERLLTALEQIASDLADIDTSLNDIASKIDEVVGENAIGRGFIRTRETPP